MVPTQAKMPVTDFSGDIEEQILAMITTYSYGQKVKTVLMYKFITYYKTVLLLYTVVAILHL